MAKILIVGYGYIGQPLAKSLVSKGNEVVAISRTNKEPTTGVSTIKADLFELDDLPEVDAVIYLVSADAHSEDMYRKAYIDGPKKIWSLFKRKKPYRFLFASSTSVYPFNDGRWVDEKSSLPEPHYFSGRILQEAEKIIEELDCLSVSMRLGGIYGPNRYYLLNQLKSGVLQPTDHPVYSNRIHQDDCVGAISHILDHLAPEKIYNIVDQEPTPINEIISWFQASLGVETPIPSQTHTPREFKTNKRVNSERLILMKYQFKYPTYREGLSELLPK